MKFSSSLAVALISSSCYAALDTQKRQAGSGTCSIGIGRNIGTISWSLTVYNVPQALQQNVNIVATLKSVLMDKGDSITVPSPIAITITNVDNTPVFNYDVPELQAPVSDYKPTFGDTKVQLDFAIPDGNVTWSTDDCWPGNVIMSAGVESWSCNFPCSISVA